MGFYHATIDCPEALWYCPRAKIDTLKLHDNRLLGLLRKKMPEKINYEKDNPPTFI